MVSLRLDYNQKLANSNKDEAAKFFTSLLMDLLDDVEEVALNQLEINLGNNSTANFTIPIGIES